LRVSTLDNLKKTAKRWLRALRDADGTAKARLARAYPGAPANPALRDVQHALAREHGHDSWMKLRESLEATAPGPPPDVAMYETVADDFLNAYANGDADALGRINERFGRSFTWTSLRAEAAHRFSHLPEDERPAGDLTIADVRRMLARAAGFSSWSELLQALDVDRTPATAERPPQVVIPPPMPDRDGGPLQPLELRITLPMELPAGAYATTTEVWQMLFASRTGDLDTVTSLVARTPGFARCEYNYMPPLHLAVREGHRDVVRYLLEQGAYNPEHTTYPYGESLLTLAEDRGYSDIVRLLLEYASRPTTTPPAESGVHGIGHIEFPKVDEEHTRFGKLVAANALDSVEKLLRQRPDLVEYPLGFWAEGVLSVPANRRFRAMVELLIDHGARVPDVCKWGRAYYFKHYDIAKVLLERGMNPNHMNWHRTTLLHDMAWEDDRRKAQLLLDHGAAIDSLDDEFQSTPLGLAARWGRRDIVRLLLERGADPNKSGAPWATPLAWADKKGHRGTAADLRQAGAR
jgi:hypothetical protein